MKIVVDENIPYLKGIIEEYGEVEYLSGSSFSADKVKDADALIVRTVAKMNSDLLQDSNVKLICSATIGYDHIDTQFCAENGIEWKNAPGCNARAVQQYIASGLISIAKKKQINLEGKTIGIVGVGNVGTVVAEVCSLLGLRVLLNDPPKEKKEGSVGFVSLGEICREADIITFHTPLVKDGEYKTYHMADDIFFRSLAKKPIIINAARGSIIDSESLKKAIKENLISGSIIDCWENEPTIDPELLQLVDIATAHIAGYSSDGKANGTRMSLNSLADFFHLDKTPIDRIKEEQPANPNIDLNAFKPTENRVQEALLKTYNIMDDDALLRRNMDAFKDLRNHYDYRREYRAYTILNVTKDEREIFGRLKFQCK